MVTLNCTLKFADGRYLTAHLTASDPTSAEPVAYTTNSAPLTVGLKHTASPSLLVARLSNLAEDLGAEFSKEQTGDYEIWAE